MTPGLLDRQLLFVSGKGGVGKTTVAAALASLGTASGRSTLACEMDAKGALAAALGCDAAAVGFDAVEVRPGLSAMAMNTEDSLREYLRVVARVPLIGRIGPLARTFDFVADAAPGVKEILAIGKVCWEVRERHYDLVVVDAEASGHVVAQLSSPRVIRDLVRVGMVREQVEWMLELLHDPQRTGLVVVTTPEEMPVSESLDLLGRVGRETAVSPAAIVVNRMPPQWFQPADAALLERLGSSAGVAAVAESMGCATGDVGAVLDAAAVASRRRHAAVGHLDHLRAGLAAAGIDRRLPVLLVPEAVAPSSVPSSPPAATATPASVCAAVTDSLAMELS
ncbi:MAG: ArsA family ATPase [Ilumatobacteraceae bacterium]